MRNLIGRWSFTLWCLGAASCSAADLGPGPMENPPPSPGQASPADNNQSTGPAALSVHLVDGPLDGLAEVNIDLQRIAIVSESGKETELGQPGAILDLLKLQGGVSEVISRNELLADRYSQLRLELGTRNSLKLSDGSVVPLRVPSGRQSGLKIQIDMNLATASRQDVFVDFDVAESLHLQMNSRVPRFMLRPVLRGVVQQRSGTLFGTLTSAGDGLPLPNVELLAEARGADGEPVVVRRVRTNGDGRYQLDLLPFGNYVVVAQPVIEGAAYELKVSDPIALTEQNAQARHDIQVQPASQQGSAVVRILSVATDQQSDLCMLYSGSAEAPVIVAAAVPQQVDYVESVRFGPLPAGDYFTKCLRRSEDANGAVQVVPSLVSGLSIGEGESQVQLLF